MLTDSMLFDAIRALALLGAANATPVIVAQVARDRWSTPLDFGYVMPDGERLFGSHKTWRGLMFGILAVVAVGALFDLSLSSSVGFAATSAIFVLLDLATARLRHGSWLRQ